MVPLERWDVDAVHADMPFAAPPPARFGGWLADADLFNAELFGVAAGEAAQVDPQQRLALEAFRGAHGPVQACFRRSHQRSSCRASSLSWLTN